jgi:hypothetical protein
LSTYKLIWYMTKLYVNIGNCSYFFKSKNEVRKKENGQKLFGGGPFSLVFDQNIFLMLCLHL